MKIIDAVGALAALAQETRLAIFRVLVKAGPTGIAAGKIAEKLALPAPTASFHLKELKVAGLLSCRREGRSLIYVADFTVMKGLIEFLTDDCCGGHPEICALPTPSGKPHQNERETV